MYSVVCVELHLNLFSNESHVTDEFRNISFSNTPIREKGTELLIGPLKEIDTS
jgi:hypothetical protein